jgi:NTP pyrophosphatase (non-canonical NTP hydrolase)
MTSKETEILNILQEECAEVIQMVSKCRRFGIDTDHLKASKPNRAKLTEEIGDVLAMINLCIKYNIVDQSQVIVAQENKFKKLKEWSNIFEDSNEN